DHYVISFTTTPDTEIHTLSLHDALPISRDRRARPGIARRARLFARADPRAASQRYSRLSHRHQRRRTMTSAKIMLGAALALSAGLASAQERPPYGNPISVDQAKRIAAGALAESKKNNWRMAISIVDNHGFPVYF